MFEKKHMYYFDTLKINCLRYLKFKLTNLMQSFLIDHTKLIILFFKPWTSIVKIILKTQ